MPQYNTTGLLLIKKSKLKKIWFKEIYINIEIFSKEKEKNAIVIHKTI